MGGPEEWLATMATTNNRGVMYVRMTIVETAKVWAGVVQSFVLFLCYKIFF